MATSINKTWHCSWYGIGSDFARKQKSAPSCIVHCYRTEILRNLKRALMKTLSPNDKTFRTTPTSSSYTVYSTLLYPSLPYAFEVRTSEFSQSNFLLTSFDYIYMYIATITVFSIGIGSGLNQRTQLLAGKCGNPGIRAILVAMLR